MYNTKGVPVYVLKVLINNTSFYIASYDLDEDTWTYSVSLRGATKFNKLNLDQAVTCTVKHYNMFNIRINTIRLNRFNKLCM